MDDDAASRRHNLPGCPSCRARGTVEREFSDAEGSLFRQRLCYRCGELVHREYLPSPQAIAREAAKIRAANDLAAAQGKAHASLEEKLRLLKAEGKGQNSDC